MRSRCPSLAANGDSGRIRPRGRREGFYQNPARISFTNTGGWDGRYGYYYVGSIAKGNNSVSRPRIWLAALLAIRTHEPLRHCE
jgi:hypothetical protein